MARKPAPVPEKPSAQNWAYMLHDYALDHLDGWTIPAAAQELQTTRWVVEKAVRRLRQQLGEDGRTNLICTPGGAGRPWVFTIATDREEAQEWARWSNLHAESRIETIRSVNASFVRGSRGNTIEGKKARYIDKFLGRLLEDLAELSEVG